MTKGTRRTHSAAFTLHMIADRTEDTVFPTVRAGFGGLCVDRIEGAFPVKVFVPEVGRRRRLNVGGGSFAILSAMTDTEIGRICNANRERVRAKFPRCSEAVLMKRIAKARKAGYALNEVAQVAGRAHHRCAAARRLRHASKKNAPRESRRCSLMARARSNRN